MPYTARTVPIPNVSIPTYVFGSPDAPLPDEPLILDPERPKSRYISLSSYRYWSQCLAAGLRDSGLQCGNRVVLLSGNDIAYPVVYMGVIMAGGIICGLNPTMSLPEASTLVKELDPTFILASLEGLQLAHQIAKFAELPSRKIYLFDRECLFKSYSEADSDLPKEDQDHTRSHWQELLNPSGAASFDWSLHITSQEQLAAIVFTSGSTDLPKGVKLSHRNIVANAVQYIDQQRHDPFGPEHGHIVMRVMWPPIYHTAPQNHFCVIMPKRGISNYMMTKFELELLLQYTATYRPDVLYLLPSLIIKLLSSPSLMAKYDLSSVRDVLVGGTPLRQTISDRFETEMPHEDCKVFQGWGMTELTCVVANIPPTDRRKTSSVGELLPNTKGKIMTPDGSKEVSEPNQPGELWIRSPNVAQGYWGRPKQTEAVFFPNGWIRTGDFAFFDNQSYLFVIERIQDVFFPSSDPAIFVLPTDIESVLLSIPDVVDAAVTIVERNHTTKSERVLRGFVVLEDFGRIDDIEKTLDKKLDASHRLTGGLFPLVELPRLPNLKVNRTALRQIPL